MPEHVRPEVLRWYAGDPRLLQAIDAMHRYGNAVIAELERYEQRNRN